MSISISRAKTSRIGTVDWDKLTFGTVFADHMVSMTYADHRWSEPRIEPYGPITFDPSLSALHYGQSVFEGMKAFRRKDGAIAVFRPDRHAARLNASSRRICLPEIDPAAFIAALDELLKVDAAWVPRGDGQSLYIRPFLFAADEALGLHVAHAYRFFIITSPVGSYFKGGMTPISLVSSGEYVRAVKGGIGMAKTGGNYAASLLPALEAEKKGFSQVLWLDGVEHRYIEEVGTSNIAFVIDNELHTPALNGSILEGVTRDSVLAVARALGIKVVERRIAIDEVMEAAVAGRLTESFGTGTAAVIVPVGRIGHEGKTVEIGDGKAGAMTLKLHAEITGIQRGERDDRFGWCHIVR